MSLQETQSFLSLISKNYHHPILDVASGTGRISQQLTAHGLYYIGVDISDSMLRLLRKKNPSELVDLVCSSATELPFHGSSFRFLTCFGLTGYFGGKVQQNLMAELSRVLTMNGRAAIDFLRPSTQPSRLIRREETHEGNRVYLLSLKSIRERIDRANFKILNDNKTPRQIQFLLRKEIGKD